MACNNQNALVFGRLICISPKIRCGPIAIDRRVGTWRVKLTEGKSKLVLVATESLYSMPA